nr:formyltransferase family protein [Methylobacterium sp. ZNC0032]
MPFELTYLSGGPRERVLEALIAAGHKVNHILVNDPNRWPKVVPTINIAVRENIPFSIIEKRNDLHKYENHIRNKICLSAGYNYIISEDLVRFAKLFLNIHGSLLPKYRGMTVPWAIEHGDKESGITVHHVDAGTDTGDIILQKPFALSEFETTRSMMRKMLALEPAVVVEALDLLERHGDSSRKPQGESADLPRRRPHHSEVDPTKPLVELIDKIRAADPEAYPAYFYHHGEKVCIRLWRPDKPAEEADLI